MSRLTNHSMLEGSISKGLISFAIPIFLGNLFQQLYNTVDALIVGNFVGKEALAAVSSSSSLQGMLVGLLQGIALGAGVLVAKYYGAKDQTGLHRAIHTSVAFGLVGGLGLTVVGVLLTPQILRWMGTPPDVLPNSVTYFRTYFMGGLLIFLYNIASGVLQSLGDSRHPLYYLVISSLINVVLDLILVAGLGYGVGAAALATVFATGISAFLGLRQLTKLDPAYRLDWKQVRFHPETLRQIFRYGIPAGVQNSVICFANVIVQSNINAFGSDAMAGCGAYMRLEGFAFLPVNCFAMGMSTFVGQNLGARQFDRVKKGTHFGLACCLSLSMGLSILMFTTVPQLMKLFNDDPNVIAYGIRQARTECMFFCLLAFSHCVAGILRGAGKATVPMLVMLVCWCLIRVTYITVMIHLFHNILVVFTAYPLTWSLSAAFFLIYYLKADWMHAFEKQERLHQGN